MEIGQLSRKATNRGYARCKAPGCGATFPSCSKPKFCPRCNAETGGKYEGGPEKKSKLAEAKCVRVNLERDDDFNLFSITTSNRDTRVFAMNGDEGGQKICYHRKCLQRRGAHTTSSALSEFSCDHLAETKNETEPMYRKNFSEDEIITFAVAKKFQTI